MPLGPTQVCCCANSTHSSCPIIYYFISTATLVSRLQHRGFSCTPLCLRQALLGVTSCQLGLVFHWQQLCCHICAIRRARGGVLLYRFYSEFDCCKRNAAWECPAQLLLRSQAHGPHLKQRPASIATSVCSKSRS